MKNLLKEFEQKHKACGRPVFIKSLDFYIESLKAFEFKKILVGLEEEIEALKKEMEDRTVTEVNMIKNIEDFKSLQDQHFK